MEKRGMTGGKRGQVRAWADTCIAGALLWSLGLTAVPMESGVEAGAAVRYELRAATVQAFGSYVAETEAENTKSLKAGSFLWVDRLEQEEKRASYERLQRGGVEMRRVNPVKDGKSDKVPGGLIHDWEGMVFIPGVKIDAVLKVLQDYDEHAIYYAPDVEKAKIESHVGDHYRVYMRFRRRKVVTVVLNTEHEVDYYRDSATRAHSRSSAVHIAEVENPGGAREKEKAPGDDNGFLWRMETWWRMEERDGGVYLQNEVVSLTRDIPVGLGWLIEPFITSIPKESLEFTLRCTRKAVLSSGNYALYLPLFRGSRMAIRIVPSEVNSG